MPRRGSPYGRGWEAARSAVLRRDGFRCVIAAAGCTGKATEVDHIVSPHDGGSPLDPSNLRASCRNCNASRGGKRAAALASTAWRDGPPVTLVWGPPMSGKSTYVAEHAAPGDLVVDYDAIADALAPGTRRDERDELHPVVSAARNAVLRRIQHNETGAPAIWIISANPNGRAIFPHHRLVELSGSFGDDKARPASALELAGQWQRAGASSREW